MHPAAKRLQARLRKLSEEAGAADEFSDSEAGEARSKRQEVLAVSVS